MRHNNWRACVSVGFADLDPPQTLAHICVANHGGMAECQGRLHAWVIVLYALRALGNASRPHDFRGPLPTSMGFSALHPIIIQQVQCLG
jgi:hypothetical protein